MKKDFEPLKAKLRIICDRLDEDEQQYFRPLIDNFKGQTQEFQRIMRDLGKFGEKISKLGFKQVIFDRGGYRYHGNVAAIADGIRESGIEV